MDRGQIPLENLDDRSWQELFDQARALVPHYAPEWTDLSPSDLGVTLIELFAWLVEQMLYRLNRVPDRTYAALLNLVGITRDPARPAITMLTFTPAPGVASVEVPQWFSVSSLSAGTEAPVTFETDEKLMLLPTALKFTQFKRGATWEDVGFRLSAAPLSGMKLALAANETVELALGFSAVLAEPMTLQVRIVNPPQKSNTWLTLTWQAYAAGDWKVIDVKDGTNLLRQTGDVVLPKIDDWNLQSGTLALLLPQENPVAAQRAAWIKLSVKAPANVVTVELGHVLFNSVSASNLVTVADDPSKPEVMEKLGISSDRPWQQFELKNRPLYRTDGSRNPYEHLVVRVAKQIGGGGFDAPEQWQVVEEFPPGDGKVCRVNPVTGTVLFGSHSGTSGTSGSGLIPPSGSVIYAGYRAVAGGETAGSKGNVPPDTLRLVLNRVGGVTQRTDGILAVTNPGPGRGGKDEENVEEARRRAPDVFRTRSRAVTLEDHAYLAREASTLVAKVAAIGPRAEAGWNGAGGLNRAAGHVNVLIVPDEAESTASPLPDSELIREVSEFLMDRRMVAFGLTVGGPRYVPVEVTSTVRIYPVPKDSAALKTRLETDLRAAAKRYFHPLVGGPDGLGWEIGQHFFVAGLFAVFQPIIGTLGFVESLTVKINPNPRVGAEPALAKIRTAGELKDLSDAVGLIVLDFEMVCSADKHDGITVDFLVS